ncbi:hypothetical protein ACFLS0_05465 [Candidatus Bipolaricaulota bacterium]
MISRRISVLFAIGVMIAAASLATVAESQLIGFISYDGFPPHYLDVAKIDGGQPCFLRQGHGFLPEQIPARTSPRLFGETYYSFELEIDGVPVPASSFNVHMDISLARYWGVKKLWSATWSYRFPPNYFTPGCTYTFTGTWVSNAPGDEYEKVRELLLIVK